MSIQAVRTKPDLVYESHEPDELTDDGYRIIWYRSSVKRSLDEKRRAKRIARAKMRIENLEERTGAHRFRTIETAQKAADKVLQEEGAQPWLRVDVGEVTADEFKQETPGRPGKVRWWVHADSRCPFFRRCGTPSANV
jgi:hypothetical protein